MIKWAGRIFAFLGIGHTLLSLALVAPDHAAAWFSGDLWRPDEGVIAMSPAMAGYWLSVGGFGVPMLTLGFTVLWMDRRGIVPPAFLGWAVLAWAAVDTVILLPSPWILAVVGSVLYLVGVRRASRMIEPVAAQAV
ncbi:hypothetical protein O1R50_23775 [Glycomyces luteolus]|uniref:Uncharacterized protein n=1 Tax=Glycomyces luteolus TaxID=2670330 RepID=A0A9X3PCP0_9ACTN|nr:hypothetical protein [Glycomyces luteolus]MDA1362662.1 hypothetical protein [Glycomyces luteolus]